MAFFFLSCCLLAVIARASPSHHETLRLKEERHWRFRTDSEHSRRKIPLSDSNIKATTDSRFAPPPPVGKHPRVHISEDELPALREHLKVSAMGKVASESLLQALENRIYAQPLSKPWQMLVKGDSSNDTVNALVAAYETQWPFVVSQTVGAAAFLQCAVYQNESECKDAAAATTTFATIVARNLAKVNPTEDFQNDILARVGNDGVALAYDYAFNSMSDEQRKIVREMLVAATAGKKTCGVGKVPYAANGNWVTFHLTLLTMSLAIEGEEGYDPGVLERSVDVMENFLQYGLHASGAPFEPFGKGAIFSQHMMAMAKRGAAARTALHPHYLATVQKFYLYSLQPFGYGFAWFEEWGGTGCEGRAMDVILAKYALPDDKAIDFVWRNVMGDDYLGNLIPQDLYYSSFYGVEDRYTAILMSSDWTGPSDWEEAVQQLDAPNTYFCKDRGILITRSEWKSKNDTWFEFNYRSDYWQGGHDHPDRGHFNLASHGKMWAQYPVMAGSDNSPPFMEGDAAEARHKSVLLVDSLGHGGVVAPPGKGEVFQDTPTATFSAANLTYAYTYSWFLNQWYDPKTGNAVCDHYVPGAELERHTINDFALEKGNESYMDKPIWQLSDGIRPLFDGDRPQNMCRRLYNPMRHYYRTAGMVRANCPMGHCDYILIMDDALTEKAARINASKSEEAQYPVYEWVMQTAPDVIIAAYNATDIILREENMTFTRRLLVRAVEVSTPLDPKTVTALSLQQYNQWTRPGFGVTPDARQEGLENSGGLGKRLVLSTRAQMPLFKVLLFPYEHGQELPQTTFTRHDENKATLTVSFPSAKLTDIFEMMTNTTTGRTQFSLSRNGQHVVDV